MIVKHPNLIPNAARSDFENNSTRQVLLESLPKFIRAVDAWANNIQEEDRAREVLADIADELAKVNQQLPAIQRDREQLLMLNAQLADVQRRLKPHIRRLESADTPGLEKARQLLSGTQSFVRDALLSQRRVRRQLEEQVVKSIQREALKPTEAEQARRETLPVNLVALLDTYGLLESAEVRRLLQYIDDNVLKVHLNEAAYAQTIRELRDYLEESL